MFMQICPSVTERKFKSFLFYCWSNKFKQKHAELSQWQKTYNVYVRNPDQLNIYILNMNLKISRTDKIFVTDGQVHYTAMVHVVDF